MLKKNVWSSVCIYIFVHVHWREEGRRQNILKQGELKLKYVTTPETVPRIKIYIWYLAYI